MGHIGSHASRVGVGVLLAACVSTLSAGGVDAHARRPDDVLSRVAQAVESEANCHLYAWLVGRDWTCRDSSELPPEQQELVRDLVNLVWGGTTTDVARDPGVWRQWRSLRCQWAIAEHVAERVRASTPDDRADPGARMSRQRAHKAAKSSLAPVCDVTTAASGRGIVLPNVGPQCAAAVGAPGSRVDVSALTRCLDTLVATWVARSTGGSARRRPNVIVILADDQRADAVGYEHPRDPAGLIPAMPTVVDRLVGEGVTFNAAFASSPVCAPSRAALLTGQYANRNGLFVNEGLLGGQFFGDRNTLALWMKNGGYRTGFFGKYMNEYSKRWESPRRPPIVPAGWDEWRVFNHSGSIPHFGFWMVENGPFVLYPDSAYSSDVLRDQAVDFIDASTGDDRPFLLWVGTATPHHPWTPAPRHRGAYNAAPLRPSPSAFEQDVSDKPAWVASLPIDSFTRRLQAEQLRRSQLEMQLSVDELVAALMAKLDALGITDETLIIYTSDNGHGWGEHRWVSKGCAWEECARVPLIVRYPPLAPLPRVDDSLVSLVDIALTVADLGGAVAPPNRDGRSLQRAIDATEAAPRVDVLVESHIAPQLRWVTLREKRFKLIEYENGELELYDLVEDPHELQNLAREPAQQVRLADMRARLDARWTGWRP